MSSRVWKNLIISTVIVWAETSLPASSSATEAASAQSPKAVRTLGQFLFYDTHLSADGKVSCATCHRPDHAYADDRALSTGAWGALGTRNAPSLLNVNTHNLFWDGRRTSLTVLVLDPLLHPSEHALPSEQALVDIVRARHKNAHRKAFGSAPVTPQTVALALSVFVLSLQNNDSLFDSHERGDTSAWTPAQERGLKLFEGPARCATCHSSHIQAPAPFTDDAFHIGHNANAIPADRLALEIAKVSESQRFVLVTLQPSVAALGRFVVSRHPEDIGSFRTPSLRNVAVTAPYMHDGSVATLTEAVDREIYWRAGGDAQLGRLTPADRADILAFLESLTSISSPSPLRSYEAMRSP